MTEEEAKIKICPINSIGMYIAMSASSTQRQVNGLIDNCRCIASDCMMWRWDISPKDVSSIARFQELNYDPTGHCGIGGNE